MTLYLIVAFCYLLTLTAIYDVLLKMVVTKSKLKILEEQNRDLLDRIAVIENKIGF